MERVGLWFDRLDVGDGEMAALAATLSAEEQAQAGRYRYALHRRRFVVRRARLRAWAGARLGVAPRAVEVLHDAHGKPAVIGLEGHFNASHSGELMLIAAAAVPLGCDIERIDAGIDWRPIADRLFAPEERTALAPLNDADGRTAFFRVWTRKEAFVKAIGAGLAFPLDAFAVGVEADPRLLRGGAGWSIAALPLADHACAVVAQTEAPLALEIVHDGLREAG